MDGAAVSDGRPVSVPFRTGAARRAAKRGAAAPGTAERCVAASATLLLACAALLAVAFPAHAAQSLQMTWNECALSGLAASDATNACDSNLGSQSLFCSFELAQPVDSVIAIEITVDIQHAMTPIPNWWRFDPTGCRAGVLSANADFSGFTACSDFWDGQATKDPPITYVVGEPGGDPSRARIFVSIAVPPDQPFSLQAGQTYYAAELAIRNSGTLGCGGCAAGACLVLNSILIGRLPTAPGGNLVIATPGEMETWATWQGGSPAAPCASVTTRRTSWGRIKNLYR